MTDIEKKYPCIFDPSIDCPVRRFIAELAAEQNILLKSQVIFPETANLPDPTAQTMKSMLTFITQFAAHLFSSQTQLQILSNFCRACPKIRKT